MKYILLTSLLLIGIGSIAFGLGVEFNRSNNKNNPIPTNTQSPSVSPTISISPTTLPNLTNVQGVVDVQRVSMVVKTVIDGDTIELTNGLRLRYIGINAPEKDQPYFQAALEFNRSLVGGKTVQLEYDIQKQDRNGRTLAYVFVDGVLVNDALVRQGFAVSQTIQPDVLYQDMFVAAQKEARESCRGLWEGLCGEKKVLGEEKTPCIKITEIHANAKGDDNANKNDEWITFQNTCSESVGMKGWLLKDSSASNKYMFGDIFILTGGKVSLYSGCGQNTAHKLYWKCPEQRYAIWNNDGDSAFLYNESGMLVSDYRY